MDERAFAALEHSLREVQDIVLSDFKPRREGEDDYSALVTTFVRQVQMREERVRNAEAGRRDPNQLAIIPHDRRDLCPLSAFRVRYPMDDRAFGFLESSRPEVRATVVSDFRPRREGEDDYSALVMSFVRAVQTRTGTGRGRDEEKGRSGEYRGLQAIGDRVRSQERGRKRDDEVDATQHSAAAAAASATPPAEAEPAAAKESQEDAPTGSKASKKAPTPPWRHAGGHSGGRGSRHDSASVD